MPDAYAPSVNGSSAFNRPKSTRRISSWQGSSDCGASWQVLNGDARVVLAGLEADSFRCVVTSPPYFWQRDYDVEGQIGLESSVEAYVNAICDVMAEVRRVLNKRGLLFLNLGDTYYSGRGQPHGTDRKHGGRRLKVIRVVDASGLGIPKKTAIGIPWRVAIAMIDSGWTLRSPIIWQRTKCLPEANVKDRPWRTYETVFMFSKSRTYDFSRRALEADRVEDVWSIPSRSEVGRQHPAAFPPELVGRCLRLGNPKGGLVLDPFAGSGTVLKVAGEMGLASVGVELNKRYCLSMVADLKNARKDSTER
jgi:DNA modification methylase